MNKYKVVMSSSSVSQATIALEDRSAWISTQLAMAVSADDKEGVLYWGATVALITKALNELKATHEVVSNE